MRYLSKGEIFSLIDNGQMVEQFLIHREVDGCRVLRWVCLSKDTVGTFSVSRCEVFDEGDLDHLDLYAFSFVEPDEPFEECLGLLSVEKALEVAEKQFGADPKKYLNLGLMQNEYAAFLRTASESWGRC